jgi:hypothetical protein
MTIYLENQLHVHIVSVTMLLVCMRIQLNARCLMQSWWDQCNAGVLIIIGRNCRLSLTKTSILPQFMVESVLFSLVFLCVVLCFALFVLCAQFCQCLLIVQSWLPLLFSLTLICPVSCVPNVASVSWLSSLDCHFCFL